MGSKMFNRNTFILHSCLASMLLQSIPTPLVSDIQREIDISNTCAYYGYGQDQSALDGYLQNLVNNPYAAPDYLFYQVECIAKYVASTTGRQVHLPSMISTLDSDLKRVCGQHIVDKWKKSMQKYMDKRDTVYNYHNYCSVEDELDDEIDWLDVSNKACFVLIASDYEFQHLKNTVDYNQGIAPWMIDDIPPKVTWGAAAFIAGRLLCMAANKEATIIGGVFQALGICMIYEYNANEDQKNWDKKQEQKKNHDGNIDIRQGQMDMPYRR